MCRDYRQSTGDEPVIAIRNLGLQWELRTPRRETRSGQNPSSELRYVDNRRQGSNVDGQRTHRGEDTRVELERRTLPVFACAGPAARR